MLEISEYQEGSEVSATARVKSLVAGVLSYEWSFDADSPNTAHPAGGTQFRAVNLDAPEKQVKLTDLFQENDIYKALMADPLVKRVISGTKPKNLAELMKALEFQTVEAGEHLYEFTPALLERFTIHHVDKSQAYVRLGLEAGSGADRYAFSQLGIALPIPERLRDEFQRAQKVGALGRSLDKIPASKQLHLDYLKPN